MNAIALVAIVMIALAVIAGAILIIPLVLIFKPKSRKAKSKNADAGHEKPSAWKCTSCGADNHNCNMCQYCGSGKPTTQERSVFEQVFGSQFTPKS